VRTNHSATPNPSNDALFSSSPDSDKKDSTNAADDRSFLETVRETGCCKLFREKIEGSATSSITALFFSFYIKKNILIFCSELEEQKKTLQR
jgi:hypothetical protein